MKITTRMGTGTVGAWSRLGLTAGALTIAIVATSAQSKPAKPAQTPPSSPAMAQAHPADASQISRGEYLVTSVAMCVQCHSPRDEHGVIIESRKFTGGAIPFLSPWDNKPFAFLAPNLAGLPGFTDEQIVALLTEGRATGRTPPKPPMPPFRMAKADAEAIVAFLRSR